MLFDQNLCWCQFLQCLESIPLSKIGLNNKQQNFNIAFKESDNKICDFWKKKSEKRFSLWNWLFKGFNKKREMTMYYSHSKFEKLLKRQKKVESNTKTPKAEYKIEVLK